MALDGAEDMDENSAPLWVDHGTKPSRRVILFVCHDKLKTNQKPTPWFLRLEEKEVNIMPGLDGTGPLGEGPMTGGARGYCNPYGMPLRYGYGRGFGWGRGMGFRRGLWPGYGPGPFWRRGFYPGWGGWYPPAYGRPYAMDPSEEIGVLRDEADALQRDLEEINRRIEELEKESREQTQ